VAEIIVARLAAVLGLKVPPMALITLGEGVDTLDRRDELADLLQASRGVNLGFRYLDGARDLRWDETGLVDEETASKIVWLDGLVLNPDRTPKNPNLLWFRNAPWLIDHGASLRFHHDWVGLTEPRIREPHGDFLTAVPGPDPVPRRRAAYVAVLWKRLKSPRPFVPVRPSPLDPNPGL
jgi:HipA-like kinase